MSSRYHYYEREIVIEADPLVMATEVLRSAPQRSRLMYERAGVWGVALGEAHKVVATRTSVEVHQHGRWHAKSDGDPLVEVQKALASLPVDGWRAYGTASFELAYLLYGLEGKNENEPLLHLTIPEVELRLQQGAALIRVLDQEQLDQTGRWLVQLDERVKQAGSANGRQVAHIACALRNTADAEAYKALVVSATQAIASRKMHKVIASRIVPVDTPVDLLETYAAGRRQNSPARSFVVCRDDIRLAGLSPETVLEVSADGCVTTQPLAGTRALESDEAENERLTADLLSDPKELAEHAMSVKLAFEELSRVCRRESVRVTDFMIVSRRGTVQHLASRLAGMLAEGQSSWTAFGALFPGVTASGIPKREALDWIQRNEAQQRGLYAGAVLTTDQDGTMDAALVLRSLFQRDAECWLRAGAGIVLQSTPARELEETCEKLESIARYLIPRSTPEGSPAVARSLDSSVVEK